MYYGYVEGCITCSENIPIDLAFLSDYILYNVGALEENDLLLDNHWMFKVSYTYTYIYRILL